MYCDREHRDASRPDILSTRDQGLGWHNDSRSVTIRSAFAFISCMRLTCKIFPFDARQCVRPKRAEVWPCELIGWEK
jgi:hypothetical protein